MKVNKIPKILRNLRIRVKVYNKRDQVNCESKSYELQSRVAVASCELQLRVAVASCELQLRVAVVTCELQLRLGSCELAFLNAFPVFR